MAVIIPFKALRPEVQYAKQVSAPPYDVLSSKEAKISAQGNPFSFLHITKSEIDLPESVDVHSDKVYEKAKENLQAFLNRKILFLESKSCYYVYRLVMQGKEQTGLVCCSSIDDYEKGIIKKHEYTRPEKEQDRINHIKTTGAQTGNVFLAYKAVEELDSIIENWKKERSPIYDFVADDAIKHTIWLINDEAIIKKITTIFNDKVTATYIADGHHRAASAAKSRTGKKESTNDENFFLTTLFPADQLRIMDYNRVIKHLNGYTPEEFLEKLRENFLINVKDKPYSPERANEFGMYLDKQWYELKLKNELNNTDPVDSLDISILQTLILEPLLGIKDQRTDPSIEFVGGIRGLDALQKKVDEDGMKIAFSLFPVSMDALIAVADSGNIMPPKSTWFEPKLRDGLLTHVINDHF